MANPFGRLDLASLSRLDFQELEERRYPAVAVARAALEAGGGAPAILNAANETAVGAFLEGKIPFPEIVSVVSEACAAAGSLPAPRSLEEAEEIDRTGRRLAGEAMKKPAASS
jgi:1-deoxy-D-xylulose-5-phosphate reductoisomerase